MSGRRTLAVRSTAAAAWGVVRRLEALPWFAVLAFLVAVPATSVWVNASGHDFARVVQIALCLVCALGVLSGGRLPRRFGGLTFALIGTLLLLAAASTLHAAELGMATRELCLSAALVGVAGIVARQVTSDGVTGLLATVAVAGGLYSALVGIGLIASLITAEHLRAFDLLIGYNNGRFFNHVQTSLLPLLALATVHRFPTSSLNRLAFLGLAAGLALLVLSEGRATGLALVVGTLGARALFGRTAKGTLFLALRIAGTAAGIYGVAFIVLPHLAHMPVDTLHADGVGDTGSAHSRFILWHIALDGIRRSPWLGIGPMHFSHTWNSDAAHPHNVYLQVAEEWGVPMLLLLLGIAFFAFRRLYRAVRDHRGDEADRRVGVVLFATLIAIAVDGGFSGNFVMPVSQVWIAVVAGAAIGWVRRRAPPAPPTQASRVETVSCRLLRWTPLVAMLWLAASVAPELGTHFLDRPGPPGTSQDAGAPRFWSNGWF